jgi:hypothetical protein
MPLPPCPRCGVASKKRHICTGSAEPTSDARKSVRRQELLDYRKMSPIEVEEDVRKALDEIRAKYVRETKETRVTYNDAIRILLTYLPPPSGEC